MALRRLMITPIVLLAVVLLFSQTALADPGAGVQEVIAEAAYPMGDSDTVSKAEVRALQLAKKNALEQVGMSSASLQYVANIPDDILQVNILDKKNNVNGDKIEFWVQIRAMVQPERAAAALKEMRGYEEYYYEKTVYIKGTDEKTQTRLWGAKKAMREDRVYFGMPISIICRLDDQVGLILCGNRYYEQRFAPQTQPQPEEDLPVSVTVKQLGTESVLGTTAQKRLRTQKYEDGKVLTELQWVDPAISWVIKRETSISTMPKTLVQECRNVKIGPQNPSLFEVPVGSTKCADFAGLFADGSDGAILSSGLTDPLQNALNAALENAAQRAVNNISGGLGF